MAHVLSLEIVELARKFGVERLGFLTLTFSDHCTDMEDAQRRFNSLNTNVLRGRYSRCVGVWERQKSGRLHVHLVVVLASDIRSGVDFEAFKRRDYRSAGPLLRSEWAFWRKTAPRYRFGRTELLPVKSTTEGIAHYVGGYIRKGIEGKLPEDKGHRIVRFIGYKRGDRHATASFSWNTDHAWLWRTKLKAFAAGVGAEDTEALSRMFGRRWAYRLQHQILGMEVGEYRSRACAEKGLAANFRQEVRLWKGLCEAEGTAAARARVFGIEGGGQPSGRVYRLKGKVCV